MKKKAVISLFLLFAVFTSLAPAVRADSADEHQIFDLVNNERSKKRLGRLDWNDRLADMARSYSKQMSKENFFSHYDLDGKTVVDRAKNVRVSWQKIGENLFYCSGLTEFNDFAVKGWMKSSSHRRNILDPEWTASGIGVYEARDGRVFVTQIFIEERVLTQRPRRAQGKEF
jgi:uncharacterized protein YkwD